VVVRILCEKFVVSGAVQGKTVVPKAWYTTYRFENYGCFGESKKKPEIGRLY
jgi:hypothetical protein